MHSRQAFIDFAKSRITRDAVLDVQRWSVRTETTDWSVVGPTRTYTPNPNFYLRDVDLSFSSASNSRGEPNGVASGADADYIHPGWWHAATLITRRHIICSNHFRFAINDKIDFVNSAGTKFTYTVTEIMSLAGTSVPGCNFGYNDNIDGTISLLDDDVDGSIQNVYFFDPPTAKRMDNLWIGIPYFRPTQEGFWTIGDYGRYPELGIPETTPGVPFYITNTGDPPHDPTFQLAFKPFHSGDSGSPIIVFIPPTAPNQSRAVPVMIDSLSGPSVTGLTTLIQDRLDDAVANHGWPEDYFIQLADIVNGPFDTLSFGSETLYAGVTLERHNVIKNWFVGSQNVIGYTNVRYVADGTLVTSVTVSGSLLDSSGNTLCAITAVIPQSGTINVVIPSNANMEFGKAYTADFSIMDSGTSQILARKRITKTARYDS